MPSRAYDGPKIGYFRLRMTRWRGIEFLTVVWLVGAVSAVIASGGGIKYAIEVVGMTVFMTVGLLVIFAVDQHLADERQDRGQATPPAEGSGK